MSLLWLEYEKEFKDLVETSFQCEKEANPEYFSKLDGRVLDIIYRDTRYNIDFLYTAFVLNDEKVMGDYARWLYRLMRPILKDCTRAQAGDYVAGHLGSIKKAAYKVVSEEKLEKVVQLLDWAIENVREEAAGPETLERPVSRFEKEIHQFMESLFSKNSRKTMYLIQEFKKKQIPLDDIYVDIIAESMRRIGELWHVGKISVDTEHYCTSVTQMAMAQLYGDLFDGERKNKTLLCACPGTELHEMGARMVADIFENNGWDSIYLGAAVPIHAMLKSIAENHPDLVALSVTMPQHLMDCYELVKQIREKFPLIKIAVGGGAFRSTHEIWKKWPVDIYTEDARELVLRANEG